MLPQRLFLIFIGFCFFGLAQDSRQVKLEQQKLRLQQEIKQINQLLFTNKKEKKSALEEVEDLAVKINTRQRLIRVMNEQANRLTQRINANQRLIEQSRKELAALKEDYAQMILRSYQSKSEKSRLMFLFSSEDFLQAYKRSQYLKQYAQFRKKQGESIEEKTQILQTLNIELAKQKEQKASLLKENKALQVAFEKERISQKGLVQSLKKKERSLQAKIQKKQKQTAAIEKEIQRLIRAAIAASNKAAGRGKSAEFALTPEAKLISKNFIANKGKLPWPVEKGVVIQGFGTQTHPVVKTTKIKSNGVTIATPKNTEVRTVFDGLVMNIISYKGSNPTVLIQHGNYITAYTNLSEVYVKKGDKVKAKQTIGLVFSNPETGKSELKFSVFKNTTPVNPRGWVYRL